MVVSAALFVLTFLAWSVIPQFEELFVEFDVALPWVTEAVMMFGRAAPFIVGFLVLCIALWYLALISVQVSAATWNIAEPIVMSIPLIGGILQRNLLARWCDTMRLCVEAAMPLPDAVEFTTRTLGSRALQTDGHMLVETLASGRRAGEAGRLKLLPQTVLAAMDLASDRGDLAGVFASLTDSYEQQSEFRLNTLQTILAPLMLLFVAVLMGWIIVGLFMPLARLIQDVA